MAIPWRLAASAAANMAPFVTKRSSEFQRTVTEPVVGPSNQNVQRPVAVMRQRDVVEINGLRRDHPQVRDQLQPGLYDCCGLCALGAGALFRADHLRE